MGQVIAFKKKKKICEMSVEFQCEILEDDSIWFRFRESWYKEGRWSEWTKVDLEP